MRVSGKRQGLRDLHPALRRACEEAFFQMGRLTQPPMGASPTWLRIVTLIRKFESRPRLGNFDKRTAGSFNQGSFVAAECVTPFDFARHP